MYEDGKFRVLRCDIAQRNTRASHGRKLSKSHGSAHVGAMRDAGATPADVWREVLPWLGVTDTTSLDAALDRWQPDLGPLGPITVS